VLSIFREVRDPRDINARHDLAELLFLALAATLCGAKSCVEIAEFVEGREEELKEIVSLEHGPVQRRRFRPLPERRPRPRAAGHRLMHHA
jgi:hypothetical protein